MADVEASQPAEDKEVVIENVNSVRTDGRGATKALADWKVRLANNVARSMFCDLVISGPVLRFYGRKADLQVAIYLYKYIEHEFENAARTATREHTEQIREEFGHIASKIVGEDNPRVYRNNWLAGAVNEISNRLYEQKRKFQQESSKSNALVVVRGDELLKFKHETWKNLSHRSPNSSSAYNSNARQAGQSFARNMPLHKGIGGAGGQKQLGGGK